MRPRRGRLLQQAAAVDPCLLLLVAGVLGLWPIVARALFPLSQVKGAAPPQPPGVCRRFLAALASSSPSLLTEADLSCGTLVSRALMLSVVSIGQGALVSRSPATSGTASGSEALVSRSLAASMFSGSLAGSALAQLLSISPLLHVPYHVAGVSLHLPTPGHLNSDLAAHS